MFIKENGDDRSSENKDRWEILIVDDEPDVHLMTKTVLKNYTFNNRKLDFYSAYNIPEAQKYLVEKSNIGLILLDVVMEEKNAGLRIVDYIRNELNNKMVRIILRTGQPGEAPEEEVIENYEINDYIEKGDITSRRLFTSITTSLRNYENLLSLKNNIQELQQLSTELQSACNRLNLLDEEKIKILSFLSHEILTPLNYIGVSQLFNEDNLSKKNQHYLKMIKTGFNRLSGLISSFLKYFELMGSELILDIKPVNLVAQINILLKEFNPKIIEKQLFIVQNIESSDEYLVQFDVAYCKKVLKILLDNAIHFSEKEGIIEISVNKSAKGRIRLMVEDNGKGIAKDNLEKVFNAYDLEDFHRNETGYGLNLPIAKYLVENHHGKIGIESDGLNLGTKLTIEF